MSNENTTAPHGILGRLGRSVRPAALAVAAAGVITGAAYASASDRDADVHRAIQGNWNAMPTARLMGDGLMSYEARMQGDEILIEAYAASTTFQQHMLVPGAIQTNFIDTGRVMADDYPADFIEAMREGAIMRFAGRTGCGAKTIAWDRIEAPTAIGADTAISHPMPDHFDKTSQPSAATMAMICEEASRG
jgi:hypothetical protein